MAQLEQGLTGGSPGSFRGGSRENGTRLSITSTVNPPHGFQRAANALLENPKCHVRARRCGRDRLKGHCLPVPLSLLRADSVFTAMVGCGHGLESESEPGGGPSKQP